MKAVIYTEYGSPDVLLLKDIRKPIPRKNELLVRVHSSTVSAATLWIRKGQFPGSWLFTFLIRLIYGFWKPRRAILGVEFSGIVEEVGSDVTLFAAGDVVYGTATGLKGGTYAEYVCIPEKWKLGVVCKKPSALTFEEAAALPVGGMTALQLLLKANPRSGEKVLVYGASGSVGTYAVQIAKYFDATVTGVCSTANLGLVKSIGADTVVDYTKEDIRLLKGQFDVVIDAVGKLKTNQLKELLCKHGRFCSVTSFTNEKKEYLDFLHKIIAERKLTPVIDKLYPLSKIVEAHRYVELGHKRGNVVIINKF